MKVFDIFRRPVGGCLLVILLVVIGLSVFLYGLDRVCYNGLSQRLPIYPGAEIVSSQHNLFSDFGMGNTVMVLTTPDDADEVRAWYARETGAYLRRALQTNDFAFRIAQGDWDISPLEDGGAQVILFGTCAN